MTAVLPTDPFLQEMRCLVVFNLRDYRGHEDWEDLVQEALIRSWLDWQKLDGRYALATVVKTAVRTALSGWFRSQRARCQWQPRERGARPVIVYLEECVAGAEDAFSPTRFEEALVDRIAAQQIAPLILAAMTPAQADYVQRTVMQERSYVLLAREKGRAIRTIWLTVQRGLERGRRQILNHPAEAVQTPQGRVPGRREGKGAGASPRASKNEPK